MQKLPRDPVILSYARSPLGKYGGVLREYRPDEMLARVLQEAQVRANVDQKDINEVVTGCANQAGEDNRNVARMAQLLAGFPISSSAITLNRLCASGLDAIIYGARLISMGDADLVLASGVESMTRAPLVMMKSNAAFKLGSPEIYDTSLGWRFFNEKMLGITPPEANGVTAERLVEQFGISRERQDNFALLSHQNAVRTHERGFFADEIIGFPITKNGETLNIERDEGPRSDTSLQQLSKLRAAFKPDGSVTAGNSSPLSDGAAALVIASSDYAKAHGHKPLARILGFASAGVDPKVMGLGPVPATNKLVKNLGLSISSFDAVEINEAFAAQVIAVIESLKIEENKVNEYGGAIALGHPLGCSGARIVISLINRLRRTNKNLGLATLCVGVGQGVSMALEAL